MGPNHSPPVVDAPGFSGGKQVRQTPQRIDGPVAGRHGLASPAGTTSYGAVNTSETLCPPKPNEFVIAAATGAFLASLGT